ncbi:GA-like domain-containing protein, partial [Psychrobacter sanguinis]
MKKIIIKINNTTKTIAEHTVVTKDGKPTVIKANKKVNYELFDPATGHAPNHIVTKRVGKDLHVSMEDDGQDSDLIIEGFYDDTDSALIGLAENGEYYYYIPDTGEVADYVTQLQIGDVEGQALGGESQVTPWWVSATESDFNALPWLVGLAGAGIVGAALSSGGGSSSGGYVPPVDTNKKVEDLVKAAEEAEKAAEDALVEANKDGVISPEENQNLTDLNQAVTDAKDKAQQAVDTLPESAGKEDFQDRLDVIDGIVVPGITDQDNDGLEDGLQSQVDDLVKAAEEAEQAAEDALVEANKDGLITHEENAQLKDLNDAVTKAKDDAQAKVNELPESTGKDDFQDRLDVIDGIVVPGITDQDKNGLDDTLQAEVDDLVKAAEEAEKAVEDALVEANKDGVITPEENATLTELNDAVTDAKDKAQQAVDTLPDSAGKEDFQDRLDALEGIIVPEITDTDGDGLDDSLAQQVQDAIDNAKEAEQAAKDALEQAQEDGLITPQEQQAIIDANQALQDAKDTVQEAIDALEPSAGKELLQSELDGINGVDVPAVNDKNADDINDLTDAQDKVAAAKQAEADAQEALDQAQTDGVISPEEQAQLQQQQDAVDAAKQAAQDAIDLLEPSTDKEGLQSDLNQVEGIVVPEITDTDGDGLDDSLAQQVQDAIDKAKEAEQAAKDALEQAQEDGLITPQEQQAIIDANQALQDAKDNAQQAVEQLPESAGKDDLQSQLDEIGNGVEVPEITDNNNDGLDDTNAENIQGLIDNAKEAEQAAKDALEQAQEDGLITPDEQQAIIDANQALQDAKDTVQEAIDALEPSAGKESLQSELDGINGVDVPAVNDKNADDINDLTDAQDKVAAAKQAEADAQEALDQAQTDGVISPEEQAQLQQQQDAVDAAKQAAQDAIDLLEPSTDKEGLQSDLNQVEGIVVPEVTDVTPPEILDAKFNNEGTQVTGTTEPDATVTVKNAAGDIIGTAQADDTGSYTVNINTPLTNGEQVTVIATDAANNSTQPVSAAAPDNTAPNAPQVTINEDGTQVTVTGEEGADVTITTPNGEITGTIENGSFTAALEPALTNGEEVSATLTDAADNESQPTTATAPDTTAPDAPVVDNFDGTTVTGQAEPDSRVTITNEAGDIIGTTTAGEDGSYSVDINTPLTNGEQIGVSATDAAGNTSEETAAAAPDNTAPNAPSAMVSDDGTAVTGVAEPGSTVSIKDASGAEIGSAVADATTGEYTVVLDPALTNGEAVTADATDDSGNTSGTTQAVAPDSTPTKAPTVTINSGDDAVVDADELNADGTVNVTITIPDDAEEGSVLAVKDANDNILATFVIGTNATAGSSVDVSVFRPADGTQLTVKATITDASGNESAPGSATATVGDTTAPDAPSVDSITNT